MEWHGRSVNPPCLESLAALRVLVAACVEHGWGPDSIAAAVAAPGVRVRLAEGSGGNLLGFVLARRILDLLEIDLVGVATEHRRCGIARALLDSLLEDETAAGLAEARLELTEPNAPALGLIRGSASWSWAGVHAITPTATMHCCSRA